MSLFDFFTRAFKSPSIVPANIEPNNKTDNSAIMKGFGTSNIGTMFGGAYTFSSDTGIPVSPYSSLQSATVYACVKVLSEDTARLPLQVRRKLSNGGWQVATDHPLTALLRAPNAWQGTFELLSFLVVSMQLRGNGYIYVERDDKGQPIRLIPLLPDRVNVMISPTNGTIYYDLNAAQLGVSNISAGSESVIHVRNLSIDGGLTGASPIQLQQNTIGLDLATKKNAASLFKQGSLIRGVLTTPAGANLSPEGRAAMAADWAATYGGSDNSHRVALLEGGTTFSPMTMDANDAQLLESRKYSSVEICRIFRVPPHKVQDLEKSTFSNIENLAQQYIDDALMGICVRIEQALERTLLFDDEQDHYSIKFDFDSLLRGDFKSRMDGYAVATLNGIMSINECRTRENLEPRPNGDELRIPLNTGPITTDVPKPTVNTPEEPLDDAKQ